MEGMKTIYQRQFEDEDKGYAYVFHGSYICPRCKRAIAVNNDLDNWLRETHHTCPKCNYSFVVSNWGNNENESEDIYKSRFCESISLKSESLHYDHDKKRFTVFYSLMLTTPTRNGLIRKTYFKKWIVDLKNHRSYFWDPTGGPNHRLINATNHFGFGYNRYHDQIVYLGSKTLWSKLLKYVCVVLGIKSTYYDIVRKNGYDAHNAFYICNILNRIPNMMIYKDDYLKKTVRVFDYESVSCHFYTRKFIKESSHEIMDYQEYTRDLIVKHNLPKSKSFWKMYLEKPYTLNEVVFYKSCGFKNPDHLLSLVMCGNLARCVNVESSNTGVQKRYDDLHGVLQLMLKSTPESQVVKKFNSIDKLGIYEVDDIFRFYHRIKKQNKNLLKTVNWSGSFVEIHDELNRLETRAKHENMEIPYASDDYHLVQEVDGYDFNLAKDTDELIEIGEYMGICVGSYRNRALNRSCKIISVKHNDKYVGCIELSTNNSLRQAKAKHNSMMTGDLACALRKWIKKQKIKDVDQCYDWQRLDSKSDPTPDVNDFDLPFY